MVNNLGIGMHKTHCNGWRYTEKQDADIDVKKKLITRAQQTFLQNKPPEDLLREFLEARVAIDALDEPCSEARVALAKESVDMDKDFDFLAMGEFEAEVGRAYEQYLATAGGKPHSSEVNEARQLLKQAHDGDSRERQAAFARLVELFEHQ